MENSNNIYELVDGFVKRYPELECLKINIIAAFNLMSKTYDNKGKLLICGNGGSASDADHIVGELMKGFKLKRSIDEEFAKKIKDYNYEKGSKLAMNLQGALPAIALHNHAALNTAFLNDVDGEFGFAQQVFGYGCAGDTFLGITTSGNSKNVIDALLVAKALGMNTIALTGGTGGEIAKMCDVCIRVPENETYIIQEKHLPIYHCLCLMLEQKYFGV